MTPRFFFLLLILAIHCVLNATTYYVKMDANGNGESWQNASGNLPNILAVAIKGDQIWVSKGVYKPTIDNNRKISFTIKEGVALYGSFAGIETSIGERIIEANYSVLSGEIGTIQKTDNTFNVLFIAHATKATTIDGFIITGGYAGGDGATGTRSSSGAGIYNEGSQEGNKSSPTIKNCRFIENTARDGGAFFNNASNGGICQPTLTNCTFQNNKAFLGGGAIFNNGKENGNASLVVKENNFIKNSAGFGGAIFNYGQNGKAISIAKNSTFTNNRAMLQGGGIFNLGGNGLSKAQLMNCRFEQNFAPKGSTVANSMTPPESSKKVTKI